jgi:Xaa-Pro aminopeptidase
MSLENTQSKEREHRWQRVRGFLKNRGLDGLVVVGALPIAGEPLDRYLSNWIPGSIVIFPLKGEPTLLVSMVPEVLALGPDTPSEEFPWIRDIRPARGSVIAAVLQEKGLEQGRIGVFGLGGLRVHWEGWIPFKTWDRVLSKLPNCTFEDVTADFAELTMVKSNEELKQVRLAAQALEQACEGMLKAVRIGSTELEVYGAVQSILCQNGVYTPKFILRSGPNTTSWGDPAWLFGVGSPRIFEAGDIIVAEIFASCGGLEAQVQMAMAIPPVSSQDSECAQLARQAYEEGLRHLQPGKKFAEVVAAMDAVLDRPDVWYLTPQIHSMNPMACVGRTGVRIESVPGVDFYRQLGTQLGTGRIRGGDVVLEPGMVFELEPNACIERHRVNIGGTAIVTENGAEPLNEIPTQMRMAG